MSRILAEPGPQPSRYVVMNRSDGNDSDVCSPNLTSGALDIESVSPELQAAVAASPRSSADPDDRGDRRRRDPAGVVVGSVVEVPNAGAYDLYFIYPMEQEVATMGLIGRRVRRRRHHPHPARRRRRLGRDPPGRQAGAPRRRGRPAAVRGQAQRADADPRRGRPRPPRHVVQRHGRQPPVADPPARGAERRAAAVRLRRLARAAHPPDDDPDGGRPIHESREDFEPTVGRSAELLAGELDRFEDLLSDLLEISRFDAGAAALDVDPVDLRGTIAKVVEAARPLAERRGSIVTCTPPTSRPRPRSTSAGSSGSCATCSSTPSSTARAGRSTSTSRSATTPSRWSSRTTASACAPGRRPTCSPGSGAPTRPGPAPPVAPAWACRSRSRTPGCTTAGCRPGASAGVGSRFRLTLPQRAGDTLHGSPLPLSPTEDP